MTDFFDMLKDTAVLALRAPRTWTRVAHRIIEKVEGLQKENLKLREDLTTERLLHSLKAQHLEDLERHCTKAGLKPEFVQKFTGFLHLVREDRKVPGRSYTPEQILQNLDNLLAITGDEDPEVA